MTERYMTARDDLHAILVPEYYGDEEFNSLLDSLATAIVRTALVTLRTEYREHRYSPNEDDGIYYAMHWLLNLEFVNGKAVPQDISQDISRDIHDWMFNGGEA